MSSRFRSHWTVVHLLFLSCFMVLIAGAADLQDPETFFKFEPGADGELLDYNQLIKYMRALEEGSDRLDMRKIGKSPLGKQMYVAFISSPANVARLDELKEINQRLAMDCEIPRETLDSWIGSQPVFVMMALSMHSSEVGPSQALPHWAYELVTTDDPKILARLDNVVLMMVPCHNPDGMDMIVGHYRKYRGTKYDGSSMPGVYHKYVGHDNNRDFITLTQSDNRAIAQVYTTEWCPQVLTEKHQMGSTSPRYFVPPYHDPIAQNIDQRLWRWSSLFGSHMARDMGVDGCSGVAQHWLFDNYWPGSTETSLWKNIISFLTEAASCKCGSPVFVEPTELRVRGKGLSEYKKSINMPDPWPGGWWRLSDIIRYEISSMWSILGTAAEQREEIVRFRNEIARDEAARGKSEPPYYYVLPADQLDQKELIDLVVLMDLHGIRVSKLGKRVEVEGRVLNAGDFIIPLSQPYRPFIKEVMERQKYPVRHYTPGGKVIHPYDITSWCLPLHRGVESMEINTRSIELEDAIERIANVRALAHPKVTLPAEFWAAAYAPTDNSAYKAAFSALKLNVPIERTTSKLEINGTVLPAGSFLLLNTIDERANLDSIVGSLPSAPLVFEKPIDVEKKPLAQPRVALVETWYHDMDAGWTRYLFDTYDIEFQIIRPYELGLVDLTERYDVIVFPDADKDILKIGKQKREDGHYHIRDYPPEFTKGMGDEGMESLMSFIDKGGLVISWRRSVPLFLEGLKIKRGEKEFEEFNLPVKDLSKKAKEKGLEVPGAFLRILCLEDHPLTYGMPKEAGVFSRGTPVLQTSIPYFDMDRRVIARYPEESILLSGYAEKVEELANRPAMVWVRKGEGRFVFMNFNPQFRASTPVTYKLLFNALLLDADK